MRRSTPPLNYGGSIFVRREWSNEKKIAAEESYRRSQSAIRFILESFQGKLNDLREFDEGEIRAEDVNWAVRKAGNVEQRRLLKQLISELSKYRKGERDANQKEITEEG